MEIVKVYANGEERRCQKFSTAQEASDYLTVIAAGAETVVSQSENHVEIQRNGETFRYEVRE